MSTQTPSVPSAPVATALSPVLWQLNLPDRFDIYSTGLIFLQMAFRALCSDISLIQFNRQLKRAEYDLLTWRKTVEPRASPDLRRGFELLALDNDIGWELLTSMVRYKARQRTSAKTALAHPYFVREGLLALSVMQNLRLQFFRATQQDYGEAANWIIQLMAKSGTEKEGGFTEAQLQNLRVNVSDVIILEGILVFHDQRVRNLMNMKIFVDTDADVRLARRIRRDTVERGRDVNSVLEQYAKFVKPAFDDFILPSKKYADVIIPRGGDNHVAIDLIVQHIHTKLGQHELCKIYPNVYVIQSTFQIRGMHTLIRDHEISTTDFVFYSDRLIRLVVEHGLGHLPFTEKQVVTPTGSVYTGVDFCKKLCGVSIVRSGESMENAVRACCKGIKIGKILIHRDGDNGKQLIYEKLPKDISERHVLLLDPVLATGNSANQAIELLIQKGVPESHIIFLNLISAPEGIHCVSKRFPALKIVTSEIDVALNEEFRVIPGMGEFGDRYFGTDD